MSPITIIIYATKIGKEPYSDWEDTLDKKLQAIIKNRLDRMRLGNLGDLKRIKDGGGVWELRIDYGPGYRIYFGKKETTMVILLTGGDKRNQKRDIAKAKQYWSDCKDVI
jgi:putative addiction module killer protein